jgi:hypothetical protein
MMMVLSKTTESLSVILSLYSQFVHMNAQHFSMRALFIPEASFYRTETLYNGRQSVV